MYIAVSSQTLRDILRSQYGQGMDEGQIRQEIAMGILGIILSPMDKEQTPLAI